jgi:Asp/Glu/Hydantoin racemase
MVACSAEGAALCYRTICREGAALLGAHDHPEISMHTHPLAVYMKCISDGDWAGVAELMLSSAGKLAQAGADFLICPDNTIHQALPLVVPRSPLPWLHIAEVVAAEAAQRGFRRLGLTGTRYLVDSEVYPETLTAQGPATDRRRAGRDRPHHHGGARLRRLPAGGGRLLPAGHGPDAKRRLRRGGPRVHGDPVDHERRELPAPDARLHAPPGAGGLAARGFGAGLRARG